MEKDAFQGGKPEIVNAIIIQILDWVFCFSTVCKSTSPPPPGRDFDFCVLFR
jgi:hypothetical protein